MGGICKAGVLVMALMLAISSSVQSASLPAGFSEIGGNEASKVYGGACDISSGTVKICCEVEHWFSNVMGGTGQYGDNTYYGDCDPNYPGCGTYGVSGCDTGVY